MLSEFESHLPHSPQLDPLPEPPRTTRTEGQTKVSGNRQIVIPKRAFENAKLNRGDRLKAVAVGDGQVKFTRIAREAQNENGPPGGGPSQQSFDDAG